MPTSADFIEGSNISIDHLGIVAGAFDTLASLGPSTVPPPTLKWMFFRFRGVRELRFRAEEAVAVMVTNMTPELWKILRLLGKEYENYYV